MAVETVHGKKLQSLGGGECRELFGAEGDAAPGVREIGAGGVVRARRDGGTRGPSGNGGRAFEAVDRLLPPPTLKETVEQTLVAARLSDSAADRATLLSKAADLLERAGGHVKTAIVMGKLDVDAKEARARLDAEGGLIGRVVPDLGAL